MNYLCTIHTQDSKKGISRDFDLDILPTETTKIKAFAKAYYTLTGGYAKITEMKATVFRDEKPLLESSVYSDVTVMYSTTFNTILNIKIPYVKKTMDKNDIKSFMMAYVPHFKSMINVLYKKVI